MIVDPLRDLPELEDVEDAARRLKGVCVRTPLLRSDELDAAIGARVWIKPEMLQRTGSFKMRGAWNRVSRIPEDVRSRGLVAYSSGNHAQGVAESALRASPSRSAPPSSMSTMRRKTTSRRELVLFSRCAPYVPSASATSIPDHWGIVQPLMSATIALSKARHTHNTPCVQHKTCSKASHNHKMNLLLPAPGTP